jgi:hypothetical protein
MMIQQSKLEREKVLLEESSEDTMLFALLRFANLDTDFMERLIGRSRKGHLAGIAKMVVQTVTGPPKLDRWMVYERDNLLLGESSGGAMLIYGFMRWLLFL